MANNSKPKPVAEAILSDETTTTPETTEDAGIMKTLSPESEESGVPEYLRLGHAAASEGEEFNEPAPETYVDVVTPWIEVGGPFTKMVKVSVSMGEVNASSVDILPQLPYVITELGIQPVALASKTWASQFGPGGAAHKYKTAVYGENGAIVHQSVVKFQNGALGEGGGINGMADSALLSILADRWRAFQSGPFASEETGKALECIEQAATWLNQRTVEREARGVQGKHEL